MKNVSFLLVTFMALASCAPVSLYYSEGAAPEQVRDDRLDCEVASLAKAPVSTQIRQGPPRYIPGTRYCPSSGRCHTRGGFFVSGEFYSVDTNARLRQELVTQCMQRSGYSPVRLPRCPAGVDKAATGGLAETQPPLTEDSCVIRNDAGDWRILAP